MTEPNNPIAAVIHADPYPFYRRLRSQRPLYYDASLGFWVASSAKLVTKILTDGDFRVRPPAQPIPAALAATALEPIFGSLVRMTDGDYQQRMKRAIISALSAITPSDLAQAVHAASIALGLASPHDLTARLQDAMYRLPAFVIARLLGIGASDLAMATTATEQFVGALAAGATPSEIDRGCSAVAHLLEMLAARPSGPASQPASLCDQLLMDAREAGLTPREAMANAIGFLSQTFDATAGLIGNGLVALARMRNDSGLSEQGEAGWIGYLTEVLRYDPPVQNTRRFAQRDIKLGGEVLQAGQAILVVLAAANRDPQLNADPDDFRRDRAASNILTFGQGAHACPGQAIALGIAASALSTLWPIWSERFETRRIIDTVTYRSLANARIPQFTS